VVEKNTAGNLTVVIMIALGIVALGFLAAYYPFKGGSNEIGKTKPTTEIQTYTDTDNDGLFDWQEALWNTDPNNPDTDNDGTFDGEEVKNSRNPLVKGPGDTLFNIAGKVPEIESSATVTQEVAKRLLSEYLIKEGQTSNGRDKIELSPALFQELENAALQDRLTKKDVSSSNKTDNTSVKGYLNIVATVIQENFRSLEGNELIILDILLEKSPEDLEPGFAPYIQAYTNAVSELKKVSTPNNFVDFHLELLNIFNNTATIDQMFIYAAEDPAQGLVAISLYLDQRNRVSALFKTLQLRLEKLDISFMEQEPAYLFTP